MVIQVASKFQMGSPVCRRGDITIMGGLLRASLLISLIICNGSIERLSMSSVRAAITPRKPPFNGSMFGKRSVIRPDQDVADGASFGRRSSTGSNELHDLPNMKLDTMDLTKYQDDLLLSALRQCLTQRQLIQTDPVESIICASFLDELKNSDAQQTLMVEGLGWQADT